MSRGGKEICCLLFGLFVMIGVDLALGASLTALGFSGWWAVGPAVVAGLLAQCSLDRMMS